uniref:Uncharacterized protein n=1 Tax=Desmodus rotundus TaxID=9430 RepID=K9IGC9_DESRO
MLNIFSCVSWPFACLSEMSVRVLCSFFNQILFLLSCMADFLKYILDTNPLSDIWFGNPFSHPVACLLILLIIFAVQKLFSLCSPTC